MSKSYFILDLSSMMWRTWHVSKKARVSPSFLFCRMLLAILKEHHPHCVIAAEDCASSRFSRQDVYPEYKNKPRDPEEMKAFHAQASEVKRILDVMMIHRLSYPGYEADDVIASVLHSLLGSQLPANTAYVIVTSDKDLYQLIDMSVSLYDLSSKQLLNANAAHARKGFWPHQTTSVLALTGDASDNIPGVPGIGIKTAVKLLEEHGGVHAVLENTDGLTPKLRDALTDCTEQVFMAYKLVQLKRDLFPGLTVPPLEINEVWKKRVTRLFKELNFGQAIIGDLYLSL